MKAFIGSSCALTQKAGLILLLTEKSANALGVDRDEHNLADILTSG